MGYKKSFDLRTTLNRFYEQPVAKVAFELTLSLTAVIFFALMAIRPTLLTMSDLIKSIDDKKKLDKQLSQKIIALSNAQDLLFLYKERSLVLNEAIPTNPEIAKTLKILEMLAGKQGLIISNLMISDLPSDIVNTNFFKLERLDCLIKITFVGEYPNIRQFVEEIRNSTRTMIIEKIVFSMQEERGDKKLTTTITINTPYYGINYGKSVSETTK